MNPASILARHGLSIGTGLCDSSAGECIVLPFQRHRIAILVVAAIALVMTLPAIGVFRQAAAGWGNLDGLFNLTTALFLSCWLLGWSLGLLLLYGLLAILCCGREVLVLRPGRIEIRLGLPGLYIRIYLDPARISGLHHQTPVPASGTAWRGPHLAFDYEGRPLALGSNLDAVAAERLAEAIRALPHGSGGHPDGHQYSSMPGQVVPAPPQAEPVTTGRSENLQPVLLALIMANLVPVTGVLLLDWNLGALMVLYWAESGIIALYHLLRMALAQRWLVLLTGPLFAAHFGAFMAVHFLFVYELFVSGNSHVDSSLAEVGKFLWNLWPALLALTLSHGLSFIYHFPGHGEYQHRSTREQLVEPYGRIWIMHVTVILGGGLSLLLGNPVVALLLLVAMKIAADVSAHRKQHLPGSSTG